MDSVISLFTFLLALIWSCVMIALVARLFDLCRDVKLIRDHLVGSDQQIQERRRQQQFQAQEEAAARKREELHRRVAALNAPPPPPPPR